MYLAWSSLNLQALTSSLTHEFQKELTIGRVAILLQPVAEHVSALLLRDTLFERGDDVAVMDRSWQLIVGLGYSSRKR